MPHLRTATVRTAIAARRKGIAAAGATTATPGPATARRKGRIPAALVPHSVTTNSIVTPDVASHRLRTATGHTLRKPTTRSKPFAAERQAERLARVGQLAG